VASGRAEVSRQFQTLFSLGAAGALTDGELLDRFASSRDAAAEAAFAALVERHGPVVLRVCRDILGNSADAEDAFQATFLVLIRRASTIRNHDSLASWLYGVALRVAACARSATARRRVREGKAAERTTEQVEADGDDLGPVLHEEVGRLPEKYRAAVVLCYWDGLTHEQAADRLRWPVGTVRSRLSWARQRLRSRLTRRGVAPAVALAVVEVSRSALAVPEALVDCTVRGGLQLLVGPVQAGVVSTSVGVLTKGVIRTMILARWKMTALVLLTVGFMAAGAGGLALQEQDAEPADAATRGARARDHLAAPKSEIDQKIDILKDYLRDLRKKVEQGEKDWVELNEPAADSSDTLQTMRGPVSLDEYRQVRAALFAINMQLIEAEALLKNRNAEIEARNAQVDPELALQKRIKDALRKDPEITSLMVEIEQLQRKLEQAKLVTRTRADPSLVHSSRQLEAKQQELRDLIARRQEELGTQTRDQDKDASLRELESQVTALKVRKGAYERLLSQIQASGRPQETDPERMASARANLAALKVKEALVQKWIEQLEIDARAARVRERR
jgi:RNA polymerase sigma factor (sigma-70 family)